MQTIKKYQLNFTQVSNVVLLDAKLSLKAKGLYAYLFSKPDGWEFHIEVMEKELKESRGQLYSIIKELIAAGYIIRQQVNSNGRFGGIVYEFIYPEETVKKEDGIQLEPYTEKYAYGQTLTHNNIYNINNTDNINNTNVLKENIYTLKSVYIKENQKNFNQFWELFPRQRRGNKQKAFTAFCRAIKEKRTTFEALIDSVKTYSASEEVKRGYAKGCAAWLNDDRFNVDYSNKKNIINRYEEF